MAGSIGPQSGLVGSRVRWVTTALLFEVADVAHVQVRKSDIRVDADVDDDTTAPVLHRVEPFLV